MKSATMDNFITGEKTSNAQFICQMLVVIFFVVGMIANAVVLWILYRSPHSRNNKHVLMLRCLAWNDILAQLGMLLLMKIKIYQVIPVQWKCGLYVCLRAFGIGSGSVAFVMAVERWFALTRPFVYQKLVTYKVVKRSIFILWLLTGLLTYLPVFGIGLYYKDDQCRRYRDAMELKDVIYAYGFLILGTSLALCIVLCNASIIIQMRKISRSQCSLLRRSSRPGINQLSTNEELEFAKLMAVLSVIFIVCWMPQMVSIPLAQFFPNSRFYKAFGKVADLLMCIYFALNPYVYVLQQYNYKGRCLSLFHCNQSLSSIFTARSRSTSTTGVAATHMKDLQEVSSE